MERHYTINAEQLAGLVASGECRVFDCRFDLKHPQQGRNSYLSAHIPGAVYADIEKNLSGRITQKSGRHPLPNTRSFASFLARSAWSPGMRIVAYDAQGGAFAARLWWLMKHYGQDCVSLLDGGINAWNRARFPFESGEAVHQRHPVASLRADSRSTLDNHLVHSSVQINDIALVDARAANRFAGEDETIDLVAGHVPGAVNRPFSQNLESNGQFKAVEQLRSEFGRMTTDGDAHRVVHMCGSGITACHNIFAMDMAGLPGSRLYSGSWSEWIRDESRPVATGPN